jgi:hypothetical protein
MVLGMKRAAIIVLTIATLVLIVSPSAYPLASSPAKSGTSAPSVIAPSGTTTGPSTTSGGGGTGGGGSDQGDADGLSGMKIKPVTQSSFALTSDRVAIALMMWWRYIVLIR